MYKVGDKIKLLVNYYAGCMPNGDGPKIGDVLEVVDEGRCTTQGNWIDKYTAEVKGVNTYGNTEFALLDKMKTRFAVGDKVISVKDTPHAPEGFIGHVTIIQRGQYGIHVTKEGQYGAKAFDEDELELLSAGKLGIPNGNDRDDITPQDIAGIARPILEERKVGKVRMDLFDEGFPNAVLEIAKVMTWANQNKGYKDHDWKQLPNASKDIPAAASRHGIKNLIQKSKGTPALQRTDEESKIVHLAHQAFNILAELELVLTGVIK